MKKLLKLCLLGATGATIIATGGSDGAAGGSGGGSGGGAKEITALHVTGIIDNDVGEARSAKTSLTFDKNGTDVTMKRAGKTYNFTASDLTTKDGKKDYNITAGDETVNLQNISTEFLESAKSYTTKDVDLWFANIGNESKELTEQGYFVVGTASDSLPSKGTSTYKGGMTGYFVSKETGSESFYLGDSKLEVDFAAQNIKGGISNMEDADSNSFGTNVDIVDGKLTSDGFTGKLKYSNGAAVTSSSIAGNFYGSDTPELGGVGQVENDTTILSFGFTAKK